MTHSAFTAAIHRIAAGMTATVMTAAAMPAFAQGRAAEVEPADVDARDTGIAGDGSADAGAAATPEANDTLFNPTTAPTPPVDNPTTAPADATTAPDAALLADPSAPGGDAAPALGDGVYGQPVNWGLDLQTAVTPMKEKMHFFHTELLLPIIVAISLFVLLLLILVVVKFRAAKNPNPSRTTHNTMLEVVWTLVPVLILVLIVIPSMKMLYFVDRAKNPEMTLKVTGYQWYWGYEYPDHGIGEYSANMLKDEELKEGQPRLLATDTEVVLPVDTDIRILVTANDVIHSWAVPAFGVKTDAVPGRTNETWVRIEREGVYYGQCSEICGTNHGFMPIMVRAVSKDAFAAWVATQGGQMPVAANDNAEAGAAVAAETPAAETPAEAGAAAGEGTPAAAESPATEQ